MGTVHQKKFLHAKCNGRKLWRGTGYSQHLKDSPHKLLSNNIFINREKEKRREQMWQNTTGGIWAPTVGSSLYSFWNFSLSVKLSKKKKSKGASWWLSGKESACQYRRQFQPLILEDPTCHRATKPVHHNYWACALEPGSYNYWSPSALEPVLHSERWEARTPQRESSPRLPH